MMSNSICQVHGFSHLSWKDASIASIKEAYTNILMKFVIDGVVSYGRFRSKVYTNLKNYQYAIEMGDECPNGFDEKTNETFSCVKRKGILVPDSASCCKMDKHDALVVFSDKMLDEDSICCICPTSKLSNRPELIMGVKCIFPITSFQRYIGICKWIGKINGVECVGIEMKNWISIVNNGSCFGTKIFDCRSGHGVLLRVSDIEIEKKANNEDLEINESGFVDLKCVYNAEKSIVKPRDLLQIGRRVELLYVENRNHEARYNKIIFGVIKWIGRLNGRQCVGVELDFYCDGGSDGVISSSESFECDPNYGAVCHTNSVIVDHYIYSVSFTVGEAFNIDCNIIDVEDWNQAIVKERELKRNGNIYIYIDKSDRILNIKGVIKWCGYIQGVSVCILEMPPDFPMTAQQKIAHLLGTVKPASHIIVNTKYLFKYRTLKDYEQTKDGIVDFELKKVTKFGEVKWRGVDSNDHLYYGFKKITSSEGGSNGVFNGQRLFQCDEGFGDLISAKIIRRSMVSKIDDVEDSEVDPSDISDLISLMGIVANIGRISHQELLQLSLEIENQNITRHLVNHLTPPINIFQEPKVLHRLVESRSFKIIENSLDACPIDDANNKLLLEVASASLKCDDFVLFEKSMNKCTNKNVLMDNGDTFITHIIKDKVSQTSVIRAIDAYEFDVTKTNIWNLSPLSLACSNMMMDVVDCIVRSIKNQESKKRVCSICMDRDISTVFNCGHNCCKECSDKINKCHICEKEILTRGVLYFN